MHSRNDKVVVRTRSGALHGMARSSDVVHSEVLHSGAIHSHSVARCNVAYDSGAANGLPVYLRYA